MKCLITAGNTQTPIDKVRCITNVFTGKTGAGLATEGYGRGHEITLLTSHPEAVPIDFSPDSGRWRLTTYRTFDELARSMECELGQGRFDVLIHAAAVSDYAVASIVAISPDRQAVDIDVMDASGRKLKSHYPELVLRLVPTPKLADRVRSDWKFRGVFVKFKLEVGLTDEELLMRAENSRLQSDADFIVANHFESRERAAFIGNRLSQTEAVPRQRLAARLWDCLEAAYRPAYQS